MGGVCSMREVEDMCTKFWSENLMEKYYLEDVNVDGK
jgi:hypothetical protein